MVQGPVISPPVIGLERISAAKELILRELETVRLDYKSHLPWNEFLRENIFPDSRLLLILQWRCIYLGVCEYLITNELLDFVKCHMNNFTLFPIAFVRVHFPEMLSNGYVRKDNLTSSPLHYDNYSGNETKTTWIPLQDISNETGHFCYTFDDELIEMTQSGFSPSDLHNMTDLEFENKYITKLKLGLNTVTCSAGEVVLFDKTLLHGSTYPKSETRISIDIRWIETKSHRSSLTGGLKKIEKDSLTKLRKLEDSHFIAQRVSKWQLFLLCLTEMFISLKIELRRIIKMLI